MNRFSNPNHAAPIGRRKDETPSDWPGDDPLRFLRCGNGDSASTPRVSNPLRVLLVEDSENDTHLIVHELERAGHTVRWDRVETAESLRTALEGQAWDLVLTDCSMPGFDASSALAVVQAAGRDIPFIVVSGTIREEFAVDLMRQGAHDYLLKDNLVRLIPAVRRELREAEDRRQRQRAEKALEESHALLQEAQAVAQFGCWSSGIATEAPLTWSGQVFRIFGVSEAAFDGRMESFYALVHPDDRERVQQANHESFTQGTPYDLEHRILRPDGVTRWVHERAGVIRDAAGRPVRLLGVVQDITERKQAAEALCRRTAFFEALADSALDGLVVVDSQGRKIYQNRRTNDLWKIPPAVADDAEDDRQVQFAASRTKHPRQFVKRVAYLYAHTDESGRDEVELKDGTVLDRYSSPVRDKQGNCFGRIWAFRDITAQKQAQERIREQAALLDETQDSILVLGRDGRLSYCNRSAEQFYGLTFGELLSQDAARLLFPENPRHCAEVCQVTLARRTWSEEVRHTTPLGARRVVLSRWTLIHDAAGQPTSFLIVNTDVTEQKRLQEQFLRAQRMESIGALASGIAHDLNNTLAPIMMASGLLRPLARSSEDQQVVAMVEESARRGSEIIQQLLTFGRGVEGQRAPLQPGSLLKEVAKVASRTFPKNVKVEQQVPQNLWFVRADPTQIYQVLLNLCINARDAMSGGGTLAISAENLIADAAYGTMNPEAKPGPYVVLQIADTGAGIPPDIQEKIFDPFFTTKEPGKGTGLGLSTALGIVKGHGGFIRVSSRVGEGARFKVYLPALAASTAQSATPGEIPARGHGQLVLVVDDEEAIRSVAQSALEANGYRVVTASDGAEALFTLSRSREPFQAVLTDMIMPVMDGPSLIRALSHHAKGLLVMAMSGLAEQERAVTQAGLRVDAFLTKPFSAQELLRALHELLSRRNNTGAPV